MDRAFREMQHGIASLNPGFEHPDFPKVLQDQLKAHRCCTRLAGSYYFVLHSVGVNSAAVLVLCNDVSVHCDLDASHVFAQRWFVATRFWSKRLQL